MLKQKEFHLSRIVEFQKKIGAQRGLRNFILLARLLLFLGAVAVFLVLIRAQPVLACTICGFTIILFLVLLKIETRLTRERNYLKNLIRVNELEIDLLEGRFEHKDDGKEFQDGHHPFVSDLDIFGRRSIFQLLNRTSTLAGRLMLSSWLLDPLADRNQILLRQRSVRELAAKTEWRQRFSALGKEKRQRTHSALAQ